MRVLVLTSSFPRFRGDSAGGFVYHLGREFERLGVELEVLAPHHPGAERHETWGRTRISRFPYFYPLKLQRLCYGAGILKNIQQTPMALMQLPSFILAELSCAFQIAKKRRVDLVHAHWSIPQGLTALFLRKLFAIPCVISLHGSDVYGLNIPFLRGLNKKVILGSDACTANSKATAERARRISGRNDIRVIPMGVDLDFFSKTLVRATEWNHKGRQEKIILYAGRLIDVKGVEYLIKAFPAVLEKQANAKLLVVGSGPRKKDLVSVTERLNLHDKVTFLDAVSQKELLQYYSIADVFVLPSIVSDEGETEGLGVVLLEAMACGVPVIGTNVGGIPDIIMDGITGLLAQPRNPTDLARKIMILLADQELCQRLSKRGYDFVKERFSSSHVAKRYFEVFSAVLEKRGTPAEGMLTKFQ